MTHLYPTGSITISKLGQATQDLRSRLDAVSEETVTGRHSDLSAHLKGRIGLAMISEKAVNDVTAERSRLELRAQRLEVAQNSLTSIQNSAENLNTRLLSAIGIGNETEQAYVARDAESVLEQSLIALNVKYGERFLFAGDATSTQPFGSAEDILNDVRTIAGTATDAADFNAQIDTYFNDPAGGFQQTIFQGSANVTDSDAVSAIDPAITELLSGLAVTALAAPGSGPGFITGSEEILNEAAANLSDGGLALTNLRSDRGVVQNEIANKLEALDMEETLLTESFNALTAKDQYEAATELSELERNLEASYLLTTRIANLSLLNYMR